MIIIVTFNFSYLEEDPVPLGWWSLEPLMMNGELRARLYEGGSQLNLMEINLDSIFRERSRENSSLTCGRGFWGWICVRGGWTWCCLICWRKRWWGRGFWKKGARSFFFISITFQIVQQTSFLLTNVTIYSISFAIIWDPLPIVFINIDTFLDLRVLRFVVVPIVETIVWRFIYPLILTSLW